MKRNIVILQHKLMHYRVPFFEILRDIAGKEGYEITLIHGQPATADLCRKDTGALSWSRVVQNLYLKVGNKQMMWQPFPLRLRNVDLLVIMQENKIISNYYLIIIFRFLKKRIAYWGHGKNFQSNKPRGLFEMFKKSLVCSVNWWFAYTKASIDVITDAGFDPDRITCLNNSIDTIKFRTEIKSVTDDEIREIKNSLHITNNTFVGLFCSSLYPGKKVSFLLEACELIKQEIDEFCMVIIGDGPLSSLLRNFSDKNPWFHHVGALRGREKALYFKIANVVLNPGLLGLHILDAFCAGLPIVSLKTSLHSPEISYLKNFQNGLLVDEDPQLYADNVIKLFSDRKLLERISKNAYKSSFDYSIENMASNFFEGIKRNFE